jgi:hypothetical protein
MVESNSFLVECTLNYTQTLLRVIITFSMVIIYIINKGLKYRLTSISVDFTVKRVKFTLFNSSWLLTWRTHTINVQRTFWKVTRIKNSSWKFLKKSPKMKICLRIYKLHLCMNDNRWWYINNQYTKIICRTNFGEIKLNRIIEPIIL